MKMNLKDLDHRIADAAVQQMGCHGCGSKTNGLDS